LDKNYKANKQRAACTNLVQAAFVLGRNFMIASISTVKDNT